MVLFDLNNTRSTSDTDANPLGSPARAFQRDVQGVKSVKRLSPHAWPFYVKSSVAPDMAERVRESRPVSNYLT